MGFIGGLAGTQSGNNGAAGMNFNAGDYGGGIGSNQAQQQNFINALGAQNGIQNQSNVYNQLGQIASGQGPNPAAAMLQQATNANNATTASMISSQRGINPGEAARLGAEQGAQNQQNSAAQAATMQAQQSLGALGQQGQIAGQQVGNQFGAIQNQGANLASLQNASVGANAGVAGKTADQQGQLAGGAMQGLGAAIGLADGGSVPSLGVNTDLSAGSSIPQSGFGQFLQSYNKSGGGTTSGAPGAQSPAMFQAGQAAGKAAGAGISALAGLFAEGGKVPAMVSPGEVYIPPHKVKEVAKGKDPIKAGERIPGKAKVKGNSYANDTVPKTLEEGGIVLPKSVMESKHPHWEAHKFVSAIMAKQGMKRK